MATWNGREVERVVEDGQLRYAVGSTDVRGRRVPLYLPSSLDRGPSVQEVERHLGATTVAPSEVDALDWATVVGVIESEGVRWPLVGEDEGDGQGGVARRSS